MFLAASIMFLYSPLSRIQYSGVCVCVNHAVCIMQQASTDDDRPAMNGHCKIWSNRKWKKRYLSLRGNVLFVYKASGVSSAASLCIIQCNIIAVRMLDDLLYCLRLVAICTHQPSCVSML